jgi:hypothetical protein
MHDSGPNSIYPTSEKFVNDEFAKLDHDQMTPWAFFNSEVPKTESHNPNGKILAG